MKVRSFALFCWGLLLVFGRSRHCASLICSAIRSGQAKTIAGKVTKVDDQPPCPVLDGRQGRQGCNS